MNEQELKNAFSSILTSLRVTPYGLGNQSGAVFALLAIKRLHDNEQVRPNNHSGVFNIEKSEWGFQEIKNQIAHGGIRSNSFIKQIIKKNPFLKDLPSTLGNLGFSDLDVLDQIENLNLSDENLEKEGTFAKVYSESLSDFFEFGRGEFSTPLGLSSLLTQLTDFEPENRIYDPCAGLAGTLIKAKQLNEKTHDYQSKLEFFGQELNSEVAILANLNLAVNGVGPHIAVGDVLSNPAFLNQKKVEKFDRIVSQLPMGLKLSRGQQNRENAFGRFEQKFNSGTLNADRYLVQHILHSLTDEGKAVFSLTPSFLWIKGAEKKLRKFLIQSDFIEAILQLPHSICNSTHVAPVVMILNKNKSMDRREKVFFIDCQRQYSLDSQGRKIFSDDNVESIKRLFDAFQTQDFVSQIISAKKIDQNDYNLNPRLYIDDSAEANKVRKLIEQHANYERFSLSHPTISNEISEINYRDAIQENNVVYFPNRKNDSVFTCGKTQKSKRRNRSHKVFKVKLNSDTVISKYVVHFYRSELGQALLNSISRSTFHPIIGLEEIKRCIVAVPPIEIQEELVSAYDKLDQLSKVLGRFLHEISLNPQSASEVLLKTQDMMSIINELSDGDRVLALIRDGESKTAEFKETLRLNVHTQEKDSRIEEGILKTIAAFLNSEGGTLLVGVDDNGSVTGIGNEMKKFGWTEDKFLLHFKNLLQKKLGETCYPYVDQRVVKIEKHKIFMITCARSEKEVFVEDTKFYVRTNPATDRLEGRQMMEYINSRFE